MLLKILYQLILLSILYNVPQSPEHREAEKCETERLIPGKFLEGSQISSLRKISSLLPLVPGTWDAVSSISLNEGRQEHGLFFL